MTVATEFEAPGAMVRISVADSGPGVPAEIKLRIFEPFFTTRPIGEGTGIGLSVCHGIVTAHGGTITVEDAPGGGACFVVRLPVGQGAEASEEHAASKPEPSLANRRVLIVDDEREVAEALSEILEHSGYSVHVANSGEAALHRVCAYGYDLVLCDMRMPDMDGIELYRRLKTAKPALAERFIVVTGDVLSATVRKFLDTTGVPCLEKPLTPVEVRRQVAAALEPPKVLRTG